MFKYDPHFLLQLVWTSGGLVINLPITYKIGSGVGFNGNYFNSAISKFWSKNYEGFGNVTVKAYTPTNGSPTNNVSVDTAKNVDSHPNEWHLGDYMAVAAYLAAHEAGHLMGVHDLPSYADWPTEEDPRDIMNFRSFNKTPYATSRDINFIIKNGGSGVPGSAPGGIFQNGTWISAGSQFAKISGGGTTISYIGIGGSWQATSSGGLNPTAYGQSLDPNAWYGDVSGSAGANGQP